MHYQGRNNIILFFFIALLWSDGIWMLLIPSAQQALAIHLNPMLAWLGLMGPGLAAIIVSYKEQKLKQLFTPLLRWRNPPINYIYVYLGVFLIYCAAAWLSVLTYGTKHIDSAAWLYEHIRSPILGFKGIGVIIEITIIYTFCEELGWRGYALPRMHQSLNALNAALILGAIWTLWHIPLIYMGGSSLTLTSGIIYFLHIECMSIFYAWLFFKSNKSLLIVGLFHGTTDGIGAFFPITNSLIGQGPNLPTVMLEITIALLMVPYLWKAKADNK